MGFVSAKDEGAEREETTFNFFHLPYPVQIEIVSLLSLKDTKSFAVTSKESNTLVFDQHMWKKKLWHLAKAVNLSLEGRQTSLNRATEILVKDPLLVDMKRLYQILGPARDQSSHSEVDMENLLSKYDPPSVMTFTSIGLQEILHYLQMFFLKPRSPRLFHDPFSKGQGAPTFLLFGPPESYLSRKLGLAFIASKDAMFETVGLVRGKPGGVGGGVTVKMGSRLMNFLPVRRARRLKLLVDKPGGTEFHPDVAEVASNVDGLIYYMDARCECELRQKAKTKTALNPDRPSFTLSSLFHNSWQVDTEAQAIPKTAHNLDHELHELEAMLKVIPEGISSPILVILVRQGTSAISNSLPEGADDDDERHPGRPRFKPLEIPGPLHTPSDIYHRLHRLRNPWMVINVDVPSLDGVRQGIHWIYERTTLMKTGRYPA